VAVLTTMRQWLPAVSGYASLVASGIFVVTLSFLFTTPRALSPSQIQALAEGAYIERAKPVVFIGECGTAKTHLVTGLCMAASRHGGDRS
jgi:uncharacterized membrane protein YkgB